jgi:hypothetical protein
MAGFFSTGTGSVSGNKINSWLNLLIFPDFSAALAVISDGERTNLNPQRTA